MKTNVTFFLVLVLLSTSIATAQRTTEAIEDNTQKASAAETPVESVAFEYNAIQNSLEDEATKRKLEENRKLSERARAERQKITDAVRKRLGSENKTTSLKAESNLAEERQRRAALVARTAVRTNEKEQRTKLAQQNQ